MCEMFEVVERDSGIVVSDEPLDWIDAQAVAEVREEKGYACEINELDSGDETPAETNEWLRSGGW